MLGGGLLGFSPPFVFKVLPFVGPSQEESVVV